MKTRPFLKMLGSLPLILWAAIVPVSDAQAAEKVNVYSHRHYEADEAVFEAFTKQTGIEVNVVKAGADELIERLKAEGENSPADILITADAGRLHRAKSEGLLQVIESDTLSERIPESLRDPEGYWLGFTMRARIIAYAKDRVKSADLSTYEALAAPSWKGRVLVCSSSSIYNQSLMASIIAANGEDGAKDWAAALRKNMARPPQGSDRDQMRAVAAGLGDVAIVNTYYVGLLASSDDPKDREVAKKLGIFFPNQDGRGAHINISGAGVTKHAKNKGNAIKFLEYLASSKVQQTYANATHEYPVKAENNQDELLKSWGDFKADALNLSKLGELNADAVKLFDSVGWE